MFRVRSVSKILVIFTAAVSLVSTGLSAQDEVPNLDDFVFHMVASTRGVMPETIIRLDNNWQILNACIEGKTYQELVEAKIPFTQSQMQIMLMWGLLEGDGAKVKTSFPIITADRTAIIRNSMKAIAENVGAEIIPEVKALATSLATGGNQSNTYSIMYSYILGELVWTKFAEKNIVIKGPVSIDQPFWNGKMWALTPARENRSMSTSLDSDHYSLKFHWNNILSGKVNMFMSAIEVISQMLREMEEFQEIRTKEVITVMSTFNIMDENGKFTIPMIDEDSTAGVSGSCNTLAGKIRDQFLAKVDFSDLTSRAQLMNEFTAFAIGYQEFCREIMPYLVAQNILAKPAILSDPNAGPEGMKELLFMTKYKSRL